MVYNLSVSENLQRQFRKPQSLPVVTMPGAEPLPVSLPSQCIRGSRVPLSTSPPTCSSSCSDATTLESSHPAQYPSLDIRHKDEEDEKYEEKRDIKTLVGLFTASSRQGPGGQLDPTFLSLPFCVLCSLGAVCLGATCQGVKKPKPKKLSAKTTLGSGAPPGLAFMNRLANQPSRTPRRKQRLRKIVSFPPSSDIFSSSSKKPSFQVQSPTEDVDMLTRRDQTKLIPFKKVCLADLDGLRRDNHRWLQLFLLNCGQKKKRNSKQKKSSPVKTSLMRKLEISEISCERKTCRNKSCVTKIPNLEDSKQGTFEWGLDSVLVGAMTRGSWLVLDNAKTNSSSVLDCLLEKGGELVVSQRGVLGGQVVTVLRHKNLRVFLLYEPMRWEIPQAMKNRSVEVHIFFPAQDTWPWDSGQFVCARLGPAAVGRGEQMIMEEVKLPAKGNQHVILRQDVLAGGVDSCHDAQLSKLGLERRLAAEMGSSVLVARDSLLYSQVLQANPLTQMVEHWKRIAILMREMLVDCLVGCGCKQLVVRQLYENKLLSGQSDSCWDRRSLPESAVRDKAAFSENISNRLALVLMVMVEPKELQDKLSTSTSCLLVKSFLFSVSSGLDDPILLQFLSLVQQLPSLLQSDLSGVCSTPLHDPGWSCLDQGLTWLHHLLLMVGLQTLTRETVETVTRAIAVHWGGVVKRLMRNLEMLGCTNVSKAMEQFDKFVKEYPQFATKLMEQLKRILSCSPMPPFSLSSWSTMSLMTKMDYDPMLKVAVHRARFIILYGTEINQSLLLYMAGMNRLGQVEQEGAMMINLDSYLRLLLILTEESQLQNIRKDQPLLPLQHRLLLNTPTYSPPQGWAVTQLALSILHSLDRPAVKQLQLTEYDPLQQCLASVKTEATTPEGLVGVFNIRDASGSTAIDRAKQKIEQLKEIEDILTSIKFEREELSCDDIMAELSRLVQALVSYYGCHQSDWIEAYLKNMLDSPPDFQGFSLLMSQILDLPNKDDRSELRVMKLELQLNCLKWQLFSLVGPIDPAQRQAIKQKYALEGLQVATERIRVMIDIFSGELGQVLGGILLCHFEY